MKKILSAALLLASMSINAQETYTNAELATEDLNGDARYVGMGGAMEALGANMSAATDNPAAMGLYRGNAASASFSVSSHKPTGNLNDVDGKTVVGFDQIGFVSHSRIGYNSHLNWGINYHKSSNFNQILAIASQGLQYAENTVRDENGNIVNQYPLTGAQNGITFEKGNPDKKNHGTYTQIDDLYQGMWGYPGLNYLDFCLSSADNYLDRDRKGYISDFDFTVSGNHHDRIYWGAAITLSNLKYRNYTSYKEYIMDLGEPNGYVKFDDTHEIEGTGVSMKAGVIFRPIEASPFRIGLSVETPTWYDLKSHSETYGNSQVGIYEPDFELFPSQGNTLCSYDFEITTPWKFGLSAGTTVGKSLALGASFNYADYSSIKSKIKDGSSYDWWTDTYYDYSHNDDVMNAHTSVTLKGVSTFKIGAEYRLIPEISLRAGYNYVAPMYKKDGVRNLFLDSPGVETASTTDYTNWDATNRFTCGIGFNIDNFYVDLAYQYNTTKGTYLPYQNCFDLDPATNETHAVTPSAAVDLTSKRHQILCTLGFKF